MEGCRPMTIGTTEFASGLVRAVPELEPMLTEHLEYYEELLLHLLMSDIREDCVSRYRSGGDDRLDRTLAYLDVALRDGDEFVENAIAVSFIEDLRVHDADMQPFIAIWPAAMKAEAGRQLQRFDDHARTADQ